LLSPSRLFYKTGWVIDDELRDIHTKTTNKLIRTIKKKLITTEKIKPFYITNDIIAHLKNGFYLELGQGGIRLNKIDDIKTI